MNRKGILAPGLSLMLVSNLLPTPSHPTFKELSDSGTCGVRPQSQRRDRAGFPPASLSPIRLMFQRG